MHKMLSIGIAAALTAFAISAWAAAAPHPQTRAEVTIVGMKTFVLKRNPMDLQVQHYDPF
jgi:hypothetical protein